MGGTYKSLGSFSIETQKFENSHMLFSVCVGYPLDSSGKVHGVCSVRVIWIITHWKKKLIFEFDIVTNNWSHKRTLYD